MIDERSPCPCGSGRPHGGCCAPVIAGTVPAASAEALMRSRYSAYVLGREDWLIASWHASTRPRSLRLAGEAPRKWLGLDVKRRGPDPAAPANPDRAIVEFVVRFRIAGRGQRLHEVSRFVREDGRWQYLEAVVPASPG